MPCVLIFRGETIRNVPLDRVDGGLKWAKRWTAPSCGLWLKKCSNAAVPPGKEAQRRQFGNPQLDLRGWCARRPHSHLVGLPAGVPHARWDGHRARLRNLDLKERSRQPDCQISSFSQATISSASHSASFHNSSEISAECARIG